MAKAKLGILNKNLRGKVGNVVYGRSTAGPTVRELVTPANPQTSGQVAMRGGLTGFARQWQTLTAAQRLAWEEYAGTLTHGNDVGNVTKVKGISAFVGVNQDLAIVGGAPVVDPPPPESTVSQFAGGTGTLTVAGGNITGFSLALTLVGDAGLGANEVIYVRASAPKSAGQSVDVVLVRQSAINRGVPYLTLAPDVFADYSARWGTAIGASEQVGLAAKIVNTVTGRSSGYLRFTVSP